MTSLTFEDLQRLDAIERGLQAAEQGLSEADLHHQRLEEQIERMKLIASLADRAIRLKLTGSALVLLAALKTSGEFKGALSLKMAEDMIDTMELLEKLRPGAPE